MTSPNGEWHRETMKQMKSRCDASLRYIIKDAREAAACADSLGNAEGAGRYLDEACYAEMEIARRQKGEKA